MAPTGPGDASRADLAPLGDEAAEHVHVLVVDVLDLRAAERAVAAAHLAVALAGTPALRRRTLFSRLRLLHRHQKGMSSSAAAGKSASDLSAAGANDWSPPPSPRPPRNCTESAITSTAWRLEPSWASHSRHSRRPSIATGRPLARYCAQFSPWLPQTVMSK